MLLVVPFLGRGWCAICPIPMPGEWLQNGALLKPRGKGFSLNRKWPRRFRNIWLQNIAFTLVALFSAVVLTQPSVTGLVLLLFLIVAFATSLIFERRAFCRYLCPVGGFIGLYSQARARRSARERSGGLRRRTPRSRATPAARMAMVVRGWSIPAR